jgi:hypothetical protein
VSGERVQPMQKNTRTIFSLAAVTIFLFCGDCVNDPALCGEVDANSTIQRIGYNAANSMLSISFVNSLSTCTGTGELPYQINRLDISLQSFQSEYSNRKAENPDIFPLPEGSSTLFNGEIGCYDSCEIAIPIDLNNVSIKYIRKRSEDYEFIVVSLDTNTTLAKEFKICDYE